MSAFVVPKYHIDLLVQVAYEGPAEAQDHRWYAWQDSHLYRAELWTKSTLGQRLIEENIKSVEAAYPNRDIRPPWTEVPYTYTTPVRHLTAVEALKAFICYDYQACEHDDYETSKAKQICDFIVARLISYVPGYDEAPWVWSAEKAQQGSATNG